MTITEFLEARIAEDEALAREAERWADAGNEPHIRWVGQGRDALVHRLGKAGPHIARHDPARVLAECAAKRELIAENCGDHVWILCALAAVHATHPDYRQEWAL